MYLQHIFISLDLFLTTLQSSLIWTFWAHEADQLSGVLPDPVFYIFFSCGSCLAATKCGPPPNSTTETGNISITSGQIVTNRGSRESIGYELSSEPRIESNGWVVMMICTKALSSSSTMKTNDILTTSCQLITNRGPRASVGHRAFFWAKNHVKWMSGYEDMYQNVVLPQYNKNWQYLNN